MQTFLETLKNEEAHLIRIIESTEKRLAKRPEGAVRAKRHGNYFQYYQINPKDKEEYPEGKFIRKKNIQLAAELVQKEYEEKILQSVKSQLSLLQKFEQRYASLEPHTVYSRLNGARKQFVIPVTYEPEWHSEKWKNNAYRKKAFPESEKGFYSNRGEHVRSKSEQIIADKYDYEKIPYHYEEELILNDGSIIHPDFTVLNVRTGQIYYHEHLGKMGDEGYAGDAIDRVHKYMRNGIFPGEQLIITAETRENPFNSRIMNQIIAHYLR